MTFSDYDSHLPYPSLSSVPQTLNDVVNKCSAELEAAKQTRLDYIAAQRKLYNEDISRLMQKFRADLEAEYDMTDHPKANFIYALAWEEGNSDGLSEVANYYSTLVDIVK